MNENSEAAALALPRAPHGLGAAGRRFWREMNLAHTFSVAELALLERCCRVLDRIASLEKLVERDGMVIDSPQGGRSHPAMVEIRRQTETLRHLVAALNLPPDPDAVGMTPRQRRAQRAAISRWGVTR